MIDRKHCHGCRNDFYNCEGANLAPGRRCWSMDTAKLVRRFRIHRDMPTVSPGAFVEVKVPSCFHATGWVFFDALPANAVEPVRRRQGRRKR